MDVVTSRQGPQGINNVTALMTVRHPDLMMLCEVTEKRPTIHCLDIPRLSYICLTSNNNGNCIYGHITLD